MKPKLITSAIIILAIIATIQFIDNILLKSIITILLFGVWFLAFELIDAPEID